MMKKLILTSILNLVMCTLLLSQSKSVNVTNPGTLSGLLTTSELTSVTTLSVAGNIDARDFAFIRDKVKNLSTLNISSASIKAYSGKEGTFADTLISYPAGEIPQFAFYNPNLLTYKSTLTTIALPASVSAIGKFAFYYCWGLTSITLPASVKDIGSLAFYGCYDLNSFSVASSNTRYASASGVLLSKSQDTLFICPNAKQGNYTIPSNVKHISSSAFENCYNLTSVSFPNSLISIGSYAFSYCSGISGNLIFPNNLKKIETGAFYGCANINGYVSIPASLTDIGTYVFFKSNNISSFQVNTGNPDYASLDDVLFSKNMDTLFICPPTKKGNYTLPTTVKLIGSYAFYNCTSLTGNINIPALTDYIGYYSFYGCTGISSFSANENNNWFATENGVLYSKNRDRLLCCPSTFTGTFEIPSAVIYIDPGAFSNCTGITGKITLPKNLNSIGSYAFYNCLSLEGFDVQTENPTYSATDGILYNKQADTLLICPVYKAGTLVLPASVRHIGLLAFDGCALLTQVYFPSGLKSIGYSAFSNCIKMNRLIFPQLDFIGGGAFYGCTSLTELGFNNAIPPVVDYYTFDLINMQTCKLMVPIGSSSAYKNAPYWSNFSSVNEINIPSNLTENGLKKPKVTITSDGIMLESSEDETPFAIYNTAGKLIRKGIISAKTLKIQFIAKGIFIVNIGRSTEKIIL
jgi:hypothetical protein